MEISKNLSLLFWWHHKMNSHHTGARQAESPKVHRRQHGPAQTALTTEQVMDSFYKLPSWLRSPLTILEATGVWLPATLGKTERRPDLHIDTFNWVFKLVTAIVLPTLLVSPLKKKCRYRREDCFLSRWIHTSLSLHTACLRHLKELGCSSMGVTNCFLSGVKDWSIDENSCLDL